MKQNWKRLISVLLAVAMLLTYAPMAVSAEEKTAASGVKLEFAQVDPATLNVPKLGDLDAAPEDEAEQPLYGDGELVRVSIELEAPATLEKQGWQTQGIAQNKSAAAYREKLQAQQDALAQRISDEILGSQLDVKWNITLAGNVISANVPYGKLDAIRALDGVKSVELENLDRKSVV